MTSLKDKNKYFDINDINMYLEEDVKEAVLEFEKYIKMLDKETKDELIIYYEKIFGVW